MKISRDGKLKWISALCYLFRVDEQTSTISNLKIGEKKCRNDNFASLYIYESRLCIKVDAARQNALLHEYWYSRFFVYDARRETDWRTDSIVSDSWIEYERRDPWTKIVLFYDNFADERLIENNVLQHIVSRFFYFSLKLFIIVSKSPIWQKQFRKFVEWNL